MRTTINLSDSSIRALKKLSVSEGVTMKLLLERAVRMLLESFEKNKNLPTLKDRSFGGQGITEEFQGAGWERIRDTIYSRD